MIIMDTMSREKIKTALVMLLLLTTIMAIASLYTTILLFTESTEQINAVLSEYFPQVIDEGYITNDIKQNILNDVNNIVGLHYISDISGTTIKAKGGDVVNLELELEPRKNTLAAVLDLKFSRNGVARY